jgi:hypothetical protein
MSDLRRVRNQYTCVRCGGPKAQHLLLCWPCHHAETVVSGSYSPLTELKLALFELALSENRGYVPDMGLAGTHERPTGQSD